MGIISAMGKAAAKEVKKTVKRKVRKVLRSHSVAPSLKKSPARTKGKKKIPVSSVSRRKS